jgi:hypothetical protein
MRLLNTWTHIGFTYTFAANTALYVTVGSNYGSNACSPLYDGSFNGAVDDFYVFCHELAVAEILVLITL